MNYLPSGLLAFVMWMCAEETNAISCRSSVNCTYSSARYSNYVSIHQETVV